MWPVASLSAPTRPWDGRSLTTGSRARRPQCSRFLDIRIATSQPSSAERGLGAGTAERALACQALRRSSSSALGPRERLSLPAAKLGSPLRARFVSCATVLEPGCDRDSQLSGAAGTPRDG